ncbi:MAG: zinc ribbon domain-containing protein [Spirochaetota bacterium]
MDFLLIVYSCMLLGILLAPFLILQKKIASGNLQQTSSQQMLLQQRKKLLLDNLKDLKIEKDTGKISETELLELSGSIVAELKEIDAELKETIPAIEVAQELICTRCGYSVKIPKAKYCPMCGAALPKLEA